MLAIAVMKPNVIELVTIPEPEPGPYEIRLKTEISFICNATDRKVIEGHFPGVDQYPLILGHESVGRVDKLGDRVRNYDVGDRVISGLLLYPPDKDYASGWGGMSEYIIAADNEAMEEDGVADEEHGWTEFAQIQRIIPEDIPVEAAGLLCTWREVYAGFSDFQLKKGDDILIFGAGPVGLSFVKFAKLLGLGFVGSVEPLAEKRQKAIEMGADEVFAPQDPEITRLSDKRGEPLDAVIDAVGREQIINAGLPLIGMAGSVCVYGVIDTPEITLKKASGPYNFNLLIHQWPSRAWEAAAQDPICEWIRAGKLDHRDFLSKEFPVKEVKEAIEYAKTGSPIKTMLRW
jgi:2-desacetyl-2-hydroxyethyl bacteriochlorophyllide A dehydrogenase